MTLLEQEGASFRCFLVSEEIARSLAEGLTNPRWTSMPWHRDLRATLGLGEESSAASDARAIIREILEDASDEDSQPTQEDLDFIAPEGQLSKVPDECKEGFEDQPLDENEPGLSQGAVTFRKAVNRIAEKYCGGGSGGGTSSAATTE